MAKVKHQCRPMDVCRLLNAAPAVLLSAMLVTIVLSWLAAYTPVAVAAWLLGGPLLLRQRRVERFAVRALCHFRAPIGREADSVGWLKGRSERLGAARAGPFDWYVLDDAQPNAYATGRRSIAVTTGLLRRLYAGHLNEDEMLVVALHEIGHHRTGGLRYGLAVWWLTWPWQTVHRLAFGLGRRLPFPGAGELLMPIVLAIAIWQVANGGGPTERVVWEIIVLVAIGLAIYVRPLIDAAIGHAAERAADAYVAALEAGQALDSARQRLDSATPTQGRAGMATAGLVGGFSWPKPFCRRCSRGLPVGSSTLGIARPRASNESHVPVAEVLPKLRHLRFGSGSSSSA
jgi:Zn-dependent protease with chaperone function